MPRRASGAPAYRLHKASGQAVVTLSGHDYYLGKYGTKASRLEYARLVGEWEANDRRPLVKPIQNDLTVVELCAAYWRHAKAWYVKNGKPTDEQACIKAAIRPLKNLYGHTPAVAFGPLALRAVRQAMIDAGGSRGYVNKSVGRIRRMFRWAVAEELIPPSVLHGLAAVDGLKRGKTAARETAPVLPVDDVTVDATLLHLNRTAADMARVQRLTGMRPGEVVALRPADVDRTNVVWEYRPESHKTEHHGRERVVYIGPKAQAILIVYLMRTEPDDYCFRPWRKPGHCRYTVAGYHSAIQRACELAFPPPAPLRRLPGERDKAYRERLTPAQREELLAWQKSHRWSPNQLRHAAATEVRRKYGLEAAQVALGHAAADVTQIYAERDTELARRVAKEVG